MGYVWVGALLSAQGLVWLLQFVGLGLLVLSAGVLGCRLIHRSSTGQNTQHASHIDSPTRQGIKHERPANVSVQKRTRSARALDAAAISRGRRTGLPGLAARTVRS